MRLWIIFAPPLLVVLPKSDLSATASLVELQHEFDRLGEEILRQLPCCATPGEVEAQRLAIFGKKGSLTLLMQRVGQLLPLERPLLGAHANQWKGRLESAFGAVQARLQDQEIAQRVAAENLDLTLPSRQPHAGRLHLITQTAERIVHILECLGFDPVEGPEAESEYYNFEAVNIGPDHPARDMQDTFYLGPARVLRTHTSSVQMRILQAENPPLRILSYGAVYRSDDLDATHTPMFHQIEGLWIDRHITMAHLKGVLEYLLQELFGADTPVRLRPSYFPFVEPGAEVDIGCLGCSTARDSPCRLCKGSGWIEILGAGLVHRRLFELSGKPHYSDTTYRGFAFGVGVERIAMLLHALTDIRRLYRNDGRWV